MDINDMQEFEEFWTTNDYWLVTVNDDFAIFQLSIKGLVIIEDDNIAKEVIEKMIMNGIKIISLGELQEYLASCVVNNC